MKVVPHGTNGKQMQVQLEQEHWLFAIQSPNMQPQYGQDLNMHTYWIQSSTEHAERSQDT